MAQEPTHGELASVQMTLGTAASLLLGVVRNVESKRGLAIPPDARDFSSWLRDAQSALTRIEQVVRLLENLLKPAEAASEAKPAGPAPDRYAQFRTPVAQQMLRDMQSQPQPDAGAQRIADRQTGKADDNETCFDAIKKAHAHPFVMRVR